MGEGMIKEEVQDMRIEGERITWSYVRSGIVLLASDDAC
jgi:hypothetical protein